jgi:spore coat protein A
MVTRRQFLKAGALAAAGLSVRWKLGPWGLEPAFAQIGGGTLDPTLVPKYQMPLVKPPVLPRDRKIKNRMGKNADYYEIAVREFSQPILPPKSVWAESPGDTTVWSYGPYGDPRTVFEGGRYFYPAFTIENKWEKPTTVKWINDLGGKQHLLPVDPSLHWANPIGRRDTRPNPTDDPTYWNHQYIDQDGGYTGPVPMVVHVHGAHVSEESDGYAEAWWLPAGANGNLTATTGTFLDYFRDHRGLKVGPGYSIYDYTNDQPATTLWYHDHTLGMTRVNVYAGPAGFWLIRSGPGDTVFDSRDGTEAILPGPAPKVKIDPFGDYYEIPIAIQDRSFNDNGDLFYPDNRAFFEGLDPSQLQIPFTFDQLGINPNADGWGLGCDGLVSDVAPIWNPEFFGNMMVVNGFTWPFLDTEQRRYRFRLLNGCNSRFLILEFSDPRVEVWQIGAEQGFLPAPQRLNDFPYPGSTGGGRATILMGPAERADVIVDFTNVPVGTTVTLLNLGPDEPFGGGVIGTDFAPAHSTTTGQVMEFRVGPALSVDNTTPPQFLQLPAVTPLTPTVFTDVSLNEEESRNIKVTEDANGNLVYDCAGEVFGPTAALLGTLDAGGSGVPKMWAEAVTENPALNSTEEWTIHNFTADAHPIHVHLVKFQVVNREGAGGVRGPEAWETGNKDTVIAYPGEVTRIKARFDLPGLYVWHCHIVEHEDNEMMRPYRVSYRQYLPFAAHEG